MTQAEALIGNAMVLYCERALQNAKDLPVDTAYFLRRLIGAAFLSGVGTAAGVLLPSDGPLALTPASLEAAVSNLAHGLGVSVEPTTI